MTQQINRLTYSDACRQALELAKSHGLPVSVGRLYPHPERRNPRYLVAVRCDSPEPTDLEDGSRWVPTFTAKP